MSETQPQHWADAIIEELADRPGPHILSTGITPSGDFHVGHSREVLTGEAVRRALQDKGIECRMNYIADTMDPLRRVYDFLDPERYATEVGKSLCNIPCPDGCHANYAEHFLAPFFDALHTLGVDLEVIYAHELYRQGRLDNEIIAALEQTETIKRILHDTTGKAETDEWSPFNPLCDACGRLTHTRVTGFDAAAKTVSYACECGSEGTGPVSQGGKLTWRVDWPARWHALGVTIEPFGKDHATRGGSYDSGQRIMREVFGGTPPHPVLYEWIGLKGQGDMSSSKGNLVSIENLTQTIPPEVVRYMIFRTKPSRHIAFDPGLPLLNLVDEYDNVTGNNRNERAAELAVLADSPPLGIPFKHLVNLVQITDGSIDHIVPILQRHNLPIPDHKVLQSRITYAQHWLKEFSPPDIRLQLQEVLPESVAELTAPQRHVLGQLASRLEPTMDGDAIHTLVYSLAAESEMAPKDLFQAIYTTFLDQSRGPRVGWFLSSLDPDFVHNRLQDAAQTV